MHIAVFADDQFCLTGAHRGAAVRLFCRDLAARSTILGFALRAHDKLVETDLVAFLIPCAIVAMKEIDGQNPFAAHILGRFDRQRDILSGLRRNALQRIIAADHLFAVASHAPMQHDVIERAEIALVDDLDDAFLRVDLICAHV